MRLQKPTCWLFHRFLSASKHATKWNWQYVAKVVVKNQVAKKQTSDNLQHPACQLWNSQETLANCLIKLEKNQHKNPTPSRVGHLNLLLIEICPNYQNARNQQASTGGGGGVLSVLSPGFLLSVLISRSSQVGSTWFLVGFWLIYWGVELVQNASVAVSINYSSVLSQEFREWVVLQ